MAMVRLDEFEAEWGKRYPAIGQAWRRAWEHLVPFFAFAPVIRKMIYTTNAVEAPYRSLRKIKSRGNGGHRRKCRPGLWPHQTVSQ
jgi:putative transposase